MVRSPLFLRAKALAFCTLLAACAVEKPPPDPPVAGPPEGYYVPEKPGPETFDDCRADKGLWHAGKCWYRFGSDRREGTS